MFIAFNELHPLLKKKINFEHFACHFLLSAIGKSRGSFLLKIVIEKIQMHVTNRKMWDKNPKYRKKIILLNGIKNDCNFRLDTWFSVAIWQLSYWPEGFSKHFLKTGAVLFIDFYRENENLIKMFAIFFRKVNMWQTQEKAELIKSGDISFTQQSVDADQMKSIMWE